MKIIAIIPSRYGSSRFQGKSLALLAGKPVIQHVYEKVAKSTSVGRAIVATDDTRIFNAVRSFNGDVVMTSAGHQSGTDRVAEAAETLGMAMQDIIINVQGDQPLFNPACLDAVVAPLIDGPQAQMSTLAYEIVCKSEYDNPKDCKVVIDMNGYALYFSRAAIPHVRDQDDRLLAYKHLGIYAYRRRFLEVFRNLPMGRYERLEKLEQLRALEYGHRIKVVLTPYDSPEVDLPEDIARIEELLKT